MQVGPWPCAGATALDVDWALLGLVGASRTAQRSRREESLRRCRVGGSEGHVQALPLGRTQWPLLNWLRSYPLFQIRLRVWWKVPDHGTAWMNQASFMKAMSTRIYNFQFRPLIRTQSTWFIFDSVIANLIEAPEYQSAHWRPSRASHLSNRRVPEASTPVVITLGFVFVAWRVESEWMRVLFGLVFKSSLKKCQAVFFAVPELIPFADHQAWHVDFWRDAILAESVGTKDRNQAFDPPEQQNNFAA
jgi:hypothetical protein